MNYLKGALLILTFSAVVYGTQDVWSQAAFTNFAASQSRAMDVDTGGSRFTGGGATGI